MKIVVVGAGYAGMLAPNRLVKKVKAAEITVINPRPGFVERVRLHQTDRLFQTTARRCRSAAQTACAAAPGSAHIARGRGQSRPPGGTARVPFLQPKPHTRRGRLARRAPEAGMKTSASSRTAHSRPALLPVWRLCLRNPLLCNPTGG